jgi:hypothetical protein
LRCILGHASLVSSHLVENKGKGEREREIEREISRR